MVHLMALTWRSIYEFTPLAVKDIIREFQKRGDDHKALKCTFNPASQSFTLEGDKNFAEAGFLEFIQIVQSQISRGESKRRRNNQNELDVGVRRITATLLNARSLQWTEHPEEEVDDFATDFSSYIPEDDETGGKRYPIVRKWVPTNKATFADCFHRDGKDLTQEIAESCGLYINSVWVDGEAKIGAFTEEDCERAVRKLERCEENFTKLRNFTAKAGHLINNEDINRYELTILVLSKQSFSTLKTTMFHPETWMAEELCFQIRCKNDKNVKKKTDRLSTVRMLAYDAKSESHFPMRLDIQGVHSAFQTPEPRDWEGYIFRAHDRVENENDDAATVVSNTTQATTADTATDVSSVRRPHVPPPSMRTMATNPETGQLQLGPRPQSVDHPEDRRESNPLASAGPRRKAREPTRAMPMPSRDQSLAASSIQRNISRPPVAQSEASDAPESGATQAGLKTESVRSGSSSSSSQAGGVSLNSLLGGSNAGNSRAPSAKAPASVMGESVAASEGSSMISGFGHPTTGLGYNAQNENAPRDTLPNQGLGFVLGARPADRGPAEPATLSDGRRAPVTTRRVRAHRSSNSAAAASQSSQEGAAEPKNIKYIMSGKAAIDLIKEEEIKTEVSSRKFVNTMNQKAPAQRRNKSEEDPEVIAKHKQHVMHQVFANGFEHARGIKGFIKFEAKLGRVILCHVPKRIAVSKASYTWKAWDEQLKSWEGLGIEFADMITSHHFDAEFVADLKLSKGIHMFSPLKAKKVTYSFECESLKQKFIIDIDAETFEPTVYNEPTTMGDVYWHCPIRSWDAKISLTHTKLLHDKEDSIRLLLDTIQINEGKTSPEISYRTRQLDFSIIRILCKRETVREFDQQPYTSGFPFTLTIVENQELHIQKNQRQKNMYRAVAMSRDEMIRTNKLWYTFSIGNRDVDNCLQQNLDLETGENTEWTTEGILCYKDPKPGQQQDKDSGGRSEVLKAMLDTTSAVIKKIDDVGYYNEQYDDPEYH